jgi:hypothetical protein
MATQLLQPALGSDTFIDAGDPNVNMTGLTTIQNYANTTSAYRRVLLRFDLDGLGLTGEQLVSAFVVLWNDGGDAGDLPATFDVHRVLVEWAVGEVTWNQARAGAPWNAPGGDFSGDVELTYQIASPLTANGNQRRLDLTELVRGWLAGTYPNYGLLTRISPLPSTTTWIRCRSSRHATANQRPLLWVEDATSPIHLAPVDNGAYNEWLKDGFANAWRCLLDPPGYADGFTTRTRATVAGQKQSWMVRSGVPANVAISALRLRVNGASFSTSTTSVRLGVRLGGADYWHGTNIVFPNNTYTDYQREWTLNPATGLAWQPAEVNGMECLVEQVGATPMGCLSRADVEVEFTVPAGPGGGQPEEPLAALIRRLRS